MLNLIGHKVHSSAKIGFSMIWIDGALNLKEHAMIGHFNLIRVNSIHINQRGYIGNYNRLNGPFEIFLDEKAAIGNGNKFFRAPIGTSYGKAILRLGLLSKITANHRVDCTRSISIGNYTTIAGNDSQIWTHAYYHDKFGPGRFRIDGDIEIGNNVNIGSRCVLNCGVTITDNVVVGSNSCISKSLLEPGTYVSRSLRFIEQSVDDDLRKKFVKVEGFDICEEVYEKKNKSN